MIKSFKVTNYVGDSLELILREPEKSGFLIKEVTGLGPAKATINTIDISTKDGANFNSARMDKRNIVFDIMFVNNEKKESIETLRQKSYRYFPVKKEITLLIETDNRLLRTTGYVESNEPDIFSNEEGCKISIICPDPFFYAVEGKTTTEYYSLSPLFEFPFSNESLTEPLLEFSKVQIDTGKNVYYSGDDEIGFIIHIYASASATNVRIYNMVTGETMSIDSSKLVTLTGSDIVNGDEIIINTMIGNKSIVLIRDGKTYNILNCFGRNSDWLVLRPGDNLIGFDADEGALNLQFRIENDVIYEGV